MEQKAVQNVKPLLNSTRTLFMPLAHWSMNYDWFVGAIQLMLVTVRTV